MLHKSEQVGGNAFIVGKVRINIDRLLRETEAILVKEMTVHVPVLANEEGDEQRLARQADAPYQVAQEDLAINEHVIVVDVFGASWVL